jgi:hypothetical protein
MPTARLSAQVVQDPADQPHPADQHICEGRDEKPQHEVGLCCGQWDEGQESTERCR